MSTATAERPVLNIDDRHTCNALCRDGRHALVVYSYVDSDIQDRPSQTVRSELRQFGWEIVALRRTHELPDDTRDTSLLNWDGRVYSPDGSRWRYPYLMIVAPLEDTP